jgi:hypothetical protein
VVLAYLPSGATTPESEGIGRALVTGDDGSIDAWTVLIDDIVAVVVEQITADLLCTLVDPRVAVVAVETQRTALATSVAVAVNTAGFRIVPADIDICRVFGGISAGLSRILSVAVSPSDSGGSFVTATTGENQKKGRREQWAIRDSFCVGPTHVCEVSANAGRQETGVSIG